VSEDRTRRFTDREVALVLRRAAEIEEKAGAGPGGGLSLEDLQEIAREVGISPAAVREAAEGLERRPGPGRWLGGAPMVRRAVHAVGGELDEQAIARLVQLIDEKADSAGAVSEALGSVRWTGADRFHSTQVTITPARGETTIQVVEKASPRMRRILHLLPAAWGSILAGATVGTLEPGAAVGAGLLGLGLGVGALVGRAAFAYASLRSGGRVERLAADLSREAHGAARQGLLDRDDSRSGPGRS
jgi:hypothetical protein